VPWLFRKGPKRLRISRSMQRRRPVGASAACLIPQAGFSAEQCWSPWSGAAFFLAECRVFLCIWVGTSQRCWNSHGLHNDVRTGRAVLTDCLKPPSGGHIQQVETALGILHCAAVWLGRGPGEVHEKTFCPDPILISFSAVAAKNTHYHCLVFAALCTFCVMPFFRMR